LVAFYLSTFLFLKQKDSLHVYNSNVVMVIIMPPPIGQVTLSDDSRLTFVCLYVSRTSDLIREQRAQEDWNWYRGSPRHTWLGHHFQNQKVKGQLAGGGAYCGGLDPAQLV